MKGKRTLNTNDFLCTLMVLGLQWQNWKYIYIYILLTSLSKKLVIIFNLFIFLIIINVDFVRNGVVFRVFVLLLLRSFF